MSTLLAATRPTRRDMVRHPWRILAAVLLIALPVFAGSWVWTDTHAETQATESGLARTEVRWSGTGCEQNVDGSQFHCADRAPDSSPVTLLEESLPEGFSASLRGQFWGTAGTDSGATRINVAQRADGRVPPPGEIWLNPVAARTLDATSGDTVTFRPEGEDPVELVVGGTVPGYQSLVAEPTLLAPADVRPGIDSAYVATWEITGPEAVTWEDVQALNEAGFTVRSQDVINDPPAPEAIPAEYREGGESPDHYADATRTIVYVAAMLVIGVLFLLLISPVFTIATSRMAQVFALMSSQGASPRHIGIAVLAYGLFAGLIGATLGAVLGVAAAAVAWFLRFPDWPFSVPWGGVLALWAAALVASVGAATVPAVVAARASISAGVQGATPDRLLRWRPWMAAGPVGLLVLGVTALVLRFTVDHDPLLFYSPLVALPSVLLLAGCAPAIVWALGRMGRKAPLAWRLALRDAGRQSLRSVPALAAIMAVLAVVLSVHLGVQASDSRDRDLYGTVYEGESVLIGPDDPLQGGPEEAGVDEVVAAVEAVVGPTRRIELRGVPFGPRDTVFHQLGDETECGDEDPSAQCAQRQRRDYVNGPLEGAAATLIEASPEMLELLVLDEGTRARALAGLSTPAVLVPEGTTVSEMVVQKKEYIPGAHTTEVLDEVTLPALPVLPTLSRQTVLTPAAMELLGATVENVGTVLTPGSPVPFSARRDLTQWAEKEAVGTSITVHPVQWRAEWVPVALAGVLGLGVVVVVILVLALSWQSARRQFALIDAVGAPPSLPSRVSGAFAGLLALTGSLVGVLVGHLGAWLLSSRTVTHPSGIILETGTESYLTPDWRVVLILVVVTPVVSWMSGSLFHRRTGEPEYRET